MQGEKRDKLMMSPGDWNEYNQGINISAYLSGRFFVFFCCRSLCPPLNTVWGPEQEQMDRAGFDVLGGHVYLHFYQGTQACRVNTPRQNSGKGQAEKGNFHFEIPGRV